MKKSISIFMTIIFCATISAQKTIHDPEAQKRSVSGYHGVSISGSIELFLIQGNEETVVISADDTSLRDRVITEVKNDILQIYPERKRKVLDWGLNSKKIRAYVSIKDIDYLSSAGSGKVHIEGSLRSDKLKIDISGSGNIDAAFAVKDLTVGLSGSANADFSGNAENSDIHISGSGNIRSYDFTTAFCKASISGSGNVKITVSKELSARISGSGNVFIKGDGMIRDYSASGSGKFKRIQ